MLYTGICSQNYKVTLKRDDTNAVLNISMYKKMDKIYSKVYSVSHRIAVSYEIFPLLLGYPKSFLGLIR